MDENMRILAKRAVFCFAILCLFYLNSIQGSKSPAVCKASKEKSPPLEKWVLYKGGVVEYAPFVRWTEGGGERILEENSNAFVSFAHLAKNQDVDILVFPEYGLSGLNIGKKKEDLISHSQIVPEPLKGNIPCLQEDNQHTYPALMNLSCTSRSLKIYLVVNVIEWQKNNSTHAESKEIFFNTQVVFDRKGEIIARYRKKNLFFEDTLTPGSEEPSSALFTTDFGVTFSLQLGFDILEEEPGIHNLIGGSVIDVAMSSAWSEGLPFHTALQTFSGWARGLGINLLVSNYLNADEFGGGSGIFSGLEPFPMCYNSNMESHSRIIVKEILSKLTRNPKIRKRNDIPNVGLIVGIVHHSNPPITLESDFVDSIEYRTGATNATLGRVLHQNLVNYTSVSLVAPNLKVKTSKTHCDGSFCCKATYSFREDLPGKATYQLIAYSGHDFKEEGKIQVYVQKCAVVYCNEDELSTCAEIQVPTDTENGFRLHKLVGLFDTEFIYPSMLRMNLDLVSSEDWEYYKRLQGQWNATIVTKTRLKNLLTASLFARIYENDSESG